MQLTGLFLSLQVCSAVKHWMFKRCDQNPFCERNREFAADPHRVYEVDVASLDTSNPVSITGEVIKQLDADEQETSLSKVGDHVVLPFKLEITSENVVHFVLDEANRVIDIEDKDLQSKLNPERYSPKDMIVDVKNLVSANDVSVNVLEDKLVVNFGANSVELEFKTVKLTLFKDGVAQLTLNKNGFLNVEHLRKRKPNENNNLWEDTFDKYKDVHVRGPEAVALDTTFEGFNNLYGIPEHADSLRLKDTSNREPYRLFNVDIFEYETNSPMPMYGTIPLITAHNRDSAVGLFWLNAADTYVDIAHLDSGSRSHWMSETGKIDVYLFLGDTPGDVLASYGNLTGTSQLPQQFAIGYHQCRWNYMSQDELLGVNTKMDEFQFPYDVIWLDIEWTDDRRYFQWNEATFEEPESMMQTLDETKRKLVVLNDPHIKAKNDYGVYTELRDNGALVKDVKGSKDYHAHCWPGDSTWIDTFNPSLKSLWIKFHALGTKLGGMAKNLYLWSDMSEPSVFSGSETTAHKGVLHHGGLQHRDVHNVYGHSVFNVTYDALYARYGGAQRPFILTRSFFSGSQKFGPMWTGDNQADWDYLRAATPMILTMGVSGYPFAGADVGGFFKNPSDELLTRWYQAGAFYPFFRAHAHVESKYREPYLLDGSFQSAARSAIELRYQLLPHFYTLFYDASQKLQPILKPMYYEYPEMPEISAVEDQFFVGSELVVAPVVSEGAKFVDVALPKSDVFYDYFTGAEIANEIGKISKNVEDINTIAAFVRGGSVITRRDRKRRSSQLMQNDPYTLLIAAARNGTAAGHLYVDDGVSFDYKVKDDYLLTDISLQNGIISGTPRHSSSSSFANQVVERIILYGVKAESATIEDANGVRNVEILHEGDALIVRNPRVEIGKKWFVKLN